MSAQAPLAEVFISFQGEGPLVGVRQLFVRVRGCDLTCKYCDTPEARDPHGECLIEVTPGALEVFAHDNPFTPARIFQELPTRAPHLHSLALTGGEPLLYPEFVTELAREAARRELPLYLETGGHKPAELAAVVSDIAFVSMDLKLPSTLTRPVPGELFARSYEAAQGRWVAVNIVVTDQVTEDELAHACSLLAAVSRRGPVILQPVTEVRSGIRPPDAEALGGLFEVAASFIDDVRVIPQCHRLSGVR